jgi:hypothetical protein
LHAGKKVLYSGVNYRIIEQAINLAKQTEFLLGRGHKARNYIEEKNKSN